MMAQKGEQAREEASLVRVLGKDIRGNKKLGAGLTDITGISWAFSNAICKALGLDKNKKVGELSEGDIKKIEESIENLEVPSFLKNRQKDFESGKDGHLLGSDLKLRIEFDVKRLRKIKSYRGVRHANKLPVRGQRTKSNFRKDRRKKGSSGIKKKK